MRAGLLEDRGRCPARSSKPLGLLLRGAGWFDSIPLPPNWVRVFLDCRAAGEIALNSQDSWHQGISIGRPGGVLLQ